MKVAQISFFLDPQARRPRKLLQDWYSLVDVAMAAALAGNEVHVIQACQHRDEFSSEGVRYHFFPPARAGESTAQSAEFMRLLELLSPEVLHVHGLGFSRDVCALRRVVASTPILLQDHADRVPRFWRRPRLRRALALADGVSFCAERQAEPFRAAKLLPVSTPVFEVPESSSGFNPGDRARARQVTGIYGDPCVLWVGHLDTNKDPLTVLSGIALAARGLPDLKLWCCFGAAPLLDAVQERIAADPLLRGRVNLLGRVPHPQVELLMQAADVFVLGSHREGSGFSLIEALACGLPPAITDIPSFRVLTGNAAVGRLWPCDESRALAEAVQFIAAQPREPQRAATRAHFEAHLSARAIGKRFTAAYEQLRQKAPACR